MLYSDYLYGLFAKFKSQLASPSTENFMLLQQIHINSSGLKAIATWSSEHFGEKIKQSLGGHGYLKYSGIEAMHMAGGFAYATAEGDNHVIIQQTSNYLLQNYEVIDYKDELPTLSLEEQLV